MPTLVVRGAGAKRVANHFVNCAARREAFGRWRGWFACGQSAREIQHFRVTRQSNDAD